MAKPLVPAEIDAVCARAVRGDKLSIARLISAFEDTRASAAAQRRRVLVALDALPEHRDGRFVGITGTPGAGKSTLVGELAARLVAGDAAVSVAVLAVDPSSQVSGGALLGDRTRVRFPVGERRLYFRSQASDRDLGGVSRATFPVCRLLARLFDLVFIETVGIGQSEVEVQQVADYLFLVLQPLAGDQVQFMKAGIMEIPDAFVLNKCDEREAARKSYHALRASLSLARPGELPGHADRLAIHRTSALTGEGVDALVDAIRAAVARPSPRAMADKERYFFSKWVRDEFGRAGLRYLAAHPRLYVADDYDDAQRAFADAYAR